jgi:hypothetical protein
MEQNERQTLMRRLAELKRLLLQTKNPAVATVLSDEIANAENRIQSAAMSDNQPSE